jgi:hypothetical protein
VLTSTQRGTAGEQLFAAAVTLSSDGELELFKPLTDDDHTDASAGRRGGVPVLALQVKTALSLDRQKLAVARMAFPEGHPREHPAFVYAIVYAVDACIQSAWVVPSADFNRLAYRGAGRRGKGIELQFMASPTRQDRWAAFRGGRLDLGPRLVRLVDEVAPGPPPSLPGDHLLIRLRR